MALGTGIVTVWKLDESSGNAADSVGSNTLTNGSVTYAAAKINNGATFTTGLTSTTSPISGTGDWTFAVWYKSSTTGTNKQIAIFGNSAQTAKQIIYLYTTVGNAIALDTAGASLITSSNTSTINGAWHLLVITHTANNFAMYIDDVSVGTGSTTGMNLGSNSMGLGYDNLNARWPWGAQLDEAYFWNVVLSGTDRTALYNAGTGKQYPFLYYSLVLAQTTFTLTGIAAFFYKSIKYVLIAAQTTFTLTGNVLTLVPKLYRRFVNQVKNMITPTNVTKSASSSFTNQTKNTINPVNQLKP